MIYKVGVDENGKEKHTFSHYEVTCQCGYKNQFDEPTCHSVKKGTSDIPCLECNLSLTEQYKERLSGPRYQKPNPLTKLIPQDRTEWAWMALFVIPPILLLPGC
jgi:hypothetical protein